jgi:glutamate-5-semialdehyde dehydrogenase
MTTSTSATTDTDLAYQHIFDAARKAARNLAAISSESIDVVLLAIAEALVANTEIIITANRFDLEKISPEDYRYDRLLLNALRVEGMASEIRKVAELKSPVGSVLSEIQRPNGLEISRVAVPLGVVGIIYESRPNVTSDAFVLCLKTLNACVLKGGSDAHHSNAAIVGLIQKVLEEHGIDPAAITLLPPGRHSGEVLLHARGMIDVVIPRGSQGLINYVRDNATIPVIETGAGIVHTYFDESGDLAHGAEIIANAKTRRISVCNALDCLIIHASRLNDLSTLLKPVAERQVDIVADERAYAVLKSSYPSDKLAPATDADFGTEFLALKMAVKTVDSLDEALDHIQHFGSKHSEAILSTNLQNIETFLQSVDAAAVYANASTAFTDGAQFGLGAEIGISTQKLHARGPMALDALTTYKWIVRGTGQTRL